MFFSPKLSKLINHQNLSFSAPLQPISTAHKQMTPPFRACHYFYNTKTFQACVQSNEWSLSKPNRPRHPAGSFGLALVQTLRLTHIFMFAVSGSEYTLSQTHIQTHTHTQTYTARYPARRPLTWTCCSHSATHKSLGSQQHCWPSVPCWTWLHGNKSS